LKSCAGDCLGGNTPILLGMFVLAGKKSPFFDEMIPTLIVMNNMNLFRYQVSGLAPDIKRQGNKAFMLEIRKGVICVYTWGKGGAHTHLDRFNRKMP
jgi:hypothetical protein